MTKTYDGGDGKGPTVSISYGKGRDKYSALREKLLDELDNESTQNDLTRVGIWDSNLSPSEARNNTLSLGGNLLLPSAIIRPATIAINSPKLQQVEKVIEK